MQSGKRTVHQAGPAFGDGRARGCGGGEPCLVRLKVGTPALQLDSIAARSGEAAVRALAPVRWAAGAR
jgi:hypothetical protein